MFHCSSEELCARVALIDSGYQVSIGVQIKNFCDILKIELIRVDDGLLEVAQGGY